MGVELVSQGLTHKLISCFFDGPDSLGAGYYDEARNRSVLVQLGDAIKYVFEAHGIAYGRG